MSSGVSPAAQDDGSVWGEFWATNSFTPGTSLIVNIYMICHNCYSEQAI